MNILKKYFVFVVIFLGSFNVAYANLEITEVMYDPAGANTSHQWIEVYNNGTDSIDLSDWSITDYDTTWHFRSISSDDSTILNPNSYALIAKTSNLADFKLKNPNLGGQILRANITLGADNGQIGLSPDKKNIISEVFYSGIMNNGNSLQKIDGVWNESAPTPSVTNTQSDTAVTTDSTSNNDNNSTATSSSIDTSTSINTDVNTNNNSSSSSPSPSPSPSSSSSSSTSKISSSDSGEYKITTKIISPKIITAGLPFYISSLTTTNKKETLAIGRYVWNFGDGTSSEMKSQQEFEHTYNYGGEYILSLSYFSNSFEKIPVATNRIIIKVISADIIINSVGNETDSFIEFENKSSYEIDLSGFIITAGTHNFIIPSGTIILPNHKLKLSSKITGFNAPDILSIVVTNQAGEVITSYPQKELPKIKNNISSLNSYDNTEYSSNKKINNSSSNSDLSVINLNDLVAQAGNLEDPISPKSIYVWFGLFGIIAIGIAVIFITRRKVIETPDYLEKEIRAEDMTIIE